MSVSTLNPPEPYSAIIFDCDGTLVDSTRLYFRAWNALFNAHGADMPWDWFAAHLGCSWPQIFSEYQEECGISLDAAAAVHSDLARGFIRAEVVTFDDLVAAGSMAEARKRGVLRSEGKTYAVRDGDVIEVLFNVAR